MYEYIKGRLVDIRDDHVILENGGIGYRIYTSQNSIRDVSLNETVIMYTFFAVREDGIYLYGFTSEEELSMFNKLILVSKIGPKVALSILSALTPVQIIKAIRNNESDVFLKVSGIGEKTAKRIILELKDRIPENIKSEDTGIVEKNDHIQLAIDGIMSLGYSKGEVYKIIKQLDTTHMDEEQIIREVLRRLSK